MTLVTTRSNTMKQPLDYIFIRAWCSLFKLDRMETRRRLKDARRTKAPADAVTTRLSSTGAHTSGYHTMASLAADAEHNAEAARTWDALNKVGATYDNKVKEGDHG